MASAAPTPARLPTAPAPGLLQFANLWTLQAHPSPRREWSLERKLATIAEAGFQGVIGAADSALQKTAAAHGLRIWGWSWCKDTRRIADDLARQQDHGAEWMNAFIGRHDTPPSKAAALAVALHRAAAKLGLPVAIETHRDTATETPDKLAALARRFIAKTGRPLPVCWDFSHHAVVKHLDPRDYSTRLITPHRSLIKAAQQFHFRPFNGHHAQIPVFHRGRITAESKAFLDFTESVMRLWRSSPQNERRAMLVCPEVGPRAAGYGLTGGPDPWMEACVLRLLLQKTWNAIPRKSAA